MPAFRLLHRKAEGERDAADKFTHDDVRYQHPSTHHGEHCSNCVHFIRAVPPRCQGVRSPIRAEDWCKRYKKE